MKDGRTTVRQHVLATAKRAPDALAAEVAMVTPLPLPPCAAHAASAFEALSSTRTLSMSGPHPLSLHDIELYGRMVAPLAHREVAWVMAMDRAFISAAQEAAHG
jgi:hypothetical protein